MASKENLYNIGRIVLAGSALSAGACSVDQKNPNPQSDQAPRAYGQVLSEAEIAQMRDYEGFMAAAFKIEPTITLSATMIPTAGLPIMEKLEQAQMSAESVQLIEKYKAELPEILNKIGADSTQIEDLEMYYPIYRAAQDRFGVPWELIWIIHEQESTVSRNDGAFESNVHYGAMQRAVEFHPQEDIDRANLGMEYLQAIPVRHFDDAAEIVWASAAIAEWAGEDGDYQRALYKYSAPGPAADRYQKFMEMERLLATGH